MQQHWTTDELIDHWTVLPPEREILANKTGVIRLGFAVMLKAFALDGRFPASIHDIPALIVAYVAQQVDVEPELYPTYAWRGRSSTNHRSQIREFYHFREASSEDLAMIADWLCTDILDTEQRPDILRAHVLAHLHELRIEPPKPRQIDKAIASALNTYEIRFCATTLRRLTRTGLDSLDTLLQPSQPLLSAPLDDEEEISGSRVVFRVSPFHELRTDSGRAGLASILEQIAKLQRLRALNLRADLFAGVAPSLVQVYRSRAATESPSELRAHPDPIRATLLAAFCVLRSGELTDSLIDLLVQTVHKIGAKAERKVDAQLLLEFRRVEGKTRLLFRMAEAAVANPDGIVREVLFPVVGEQTLTDLLKEYKATNAAYRRKVHTVLRNSYRSHYRRMVPLLLEALDFRSNNVIHRPVIQALALLKKYVDSSLRFYPEDEDVPIAGVIPAGMHEIIIETDKDGQERLNRINYEICVLQVLRDGLRSREIWVSGAIKWRNPDDDLPKDFESQRSAYYTALKQPEEVELFITNLQDQLRKALRILHEGLPKNHKVHILSKGDGWISITPLEPLPEPLHLAGLKGEIGRRWPMISLLDILKEVDLRVGFTDRFKSVAAREILDRATVQKRLLLCLGLAPIWGSSVLLPVTTRSATTICAIFAGAFSSGTDYGLRLSMSSTRSCTCVDQRFGAKRQLRVPRTPRSLAHGMATY
jgi:hypothetical protein